MSHMAIKEAFEKSLAAMPDTISTAYENAKFKSVDGVPYQAVKLVPKPPLNPVYGNDYYRERGFFRLLLFFPLQEGTAEAATYAQKVRDWFYRGRTLQEDGLDIIIATTPQISGASKIDDRYVIGIDVEYFASVYI